MQALERERKRQEGYREMNITPFSIFLKVECAITTAYITLFPAVIGKARGEKRCIDNSSASFTSLERYKEIL